MSKLLNNTEKLNKNASEILNYCCNDKIHTTNINRKEKYRINTDLKEINYKTTIVKYPENREAVQFLLDIHIKDKISKRYFSGHAKVLQGLVKNNKIYYPYLPIPTLEKEILSLIEKGNIYDSKVIINEFKNFINNLPAISCIPNKFFDKFKINYSRFDKPIRCLKIAPIDCIPSNILVDKECWIIIDNEWIYDFPLPVEFLLYRALYSLTINLKTNILKNLDKHNCFRIHSGYGENRLYIPLCWIDYFQLNKKNIKKFNSWEWHFKKHVLLNAKLSKIRIKSMANLFIGSKLNHCSVKIEEYLKRYYLKLLS